MDILDQIKAYAPENEQETVDQKRMIELLENAPDAFLRSNLTAHMTASAWVVNKARTKVLMAYHNIYQSWSWLGGHADGERDLLKVAVREAQEEAGLTEVRPVMEDIFSLEVLTVEGHVKRGQYVSGHLHFNVTYLLEADEADEIRIKPDENSRIGWLSCEEALTKPTETWMVERVYRKLVQKMKL